MVLAVTGRVDMALAGTILTEQVDTEPAGTTHTKLNHLRFKISLCSTVNLQPSIMKQVRLWQIKIKDDNRLCIT